VGFKFTDIGANEVHQTEVLVWPSGELAPSRYTGDLDIRDKKRKPRGTRSLGQQLWWELNEVNPPY